VVLGDGQPLDPTGRRHEVRRGLGGQRRPLVDPARDERNLIRRQRAALERHAVLAALTAQPAHEVAGVGLAGHDQAVGDPALHQAAGAAELQPALGLLRAVAGHAGLLEDGQDLRGEVDRWVLRPGGGRGQRDRGETGGGETGPGHGGRII
jgi:hypothetical protein